MHNELFYMMPNNTIGDSETLEIFRHRDLISLPCLLVFFFLERWDVVYVILLC